jgi:hypothetical protein
MIAFFAPVILVLGAGLFAAGSLSFLDIHFFESRIGRESEAYRSSSWPNLFSPPAI